MHDRSMLCFWQLSGTCNKKKPSNLDWYQSKKQQNIWKKYSWKYWTDISPAVEMCRDWYQSWLKLVSDVPLSQSYNRSLMGFCFLWFNIIYATIHANVEIATWRSEAWTCFKWLSKISFPASLQQDWEMHWCILTLTRLHSTMVSAWKFALDSTFEKEWKMVFVERRNVNNYPVSLFVFNSIAGTFYWRGKKIIDTVQKQSAHTLKFSRRVYF